MSTAPIAQGPVECKVIPHTPGPWTVMSGDNYEVRSPLLPREYPHRCKEDSTGDFVAYVGNHAKDFGEANARLIAAAPDLLEALRDMVSDHKCLSDATLRFARAAIAKATDHEV